MDRIFAKHLSHKTVAELATGAVVDTFSTEYGHCSKVVVNKEGLCVLVGYTPSSHTDEYLNALFPSLAHYRAWYHELWYVDREAPECRRGLVHAELRKEWKQVSLHEVLASAKAGAG